jgi:hypothetical protein
VQVVVGTEKQQQTEITALQILVVGVVVAVVQQKAAAQAALES